MPICRDSFSYKAPKRVEARITCANANALYSLIVATLPRDADAVPKQQEFDRSQLEAGVHWDLIPARYYEIALACDQAVDLKTVLSVEGKEVCCTGPCNSGGAGLAGYWTITTWRES